MHLTLRSCRQPPNIEQLPAAKAAGKQRLLQLISQRKVAELAMVDHLMSVKDQRNTVGNDKTQCFSKRPSAAPATL